MDFKNRMLSTGIEYYQEIRYIQKNQKAFQNIVAILKINSNDFGLFCFYM